MNKTSPTVVANPERSAYLHWINDGLAATREDQVGPAIALQVDKGDSLSLETWAKFERKPNYTRNATTGMLADLLGSVFVNAAYGLETATQAKQVFNTNLSAALGGTGGDAATHPYAYLNYLIFDNNYVGFATNYRTDDKMALSVDLGVALFANSSTDQLDWIIDTHAVTDFIFQPELSFKISPMLTIGVQYRYAKDLNSAYTFFYSNVSVPKDYEHYYTTKALLVSVRFKLPNPTTVHE